MKESRVGGKEVRRLEIKLGWHMGYVTSMWFCVMIPWRAIDE